MVINIYKLKKKKKDGFKAQFIAVPVCGTTNNATTSPLSLPQPSNN